MNQCQYQVISKTNSMTGKKRGRIQCFKLRKGVQNVACDSFISAVPNSTCSLDPFIPTVTFPTWFPEPLYLRTPTVLWLYHSTTPLPPLSFYLLSHFMETSELWSFHFLSIQLFNYAPNKLPPPAHWWVTPAVQLSAAGKNNAVWHLHNPPHCSQWVLFLNHNPEDIYYLKPFQTPKYAF